MLVVLSLVACLQAEPDVCQMAFPDRLPPEPLALTTCLVLGPRIAAEWQTAHPGMVVRKIRCSVGSMPRMRELLEDVPA